MVDLQNQFDAQFGIGRAAPYPLRDYWVGVDGKTGDLGYEWSDKPHRLVYDLIHHSVHLEGRIADLEAQLAERVKGLDPDMPAQQLRMHLGEMTAQELRTARAAIRFANSALSALEATPPAPKVTDEMAEAASREYMRIFGKHLLIKHARLILTAALEASR